MQVMVTILGLRAEETIYVLDGKRQRAQLAAVALLRLLPCELRPERLYALCTPAARERTFPLLEEEVAGDVALEALEVPEGYGDEDIDAFLRTVARVIEPGAEVIFDLTHGFRHLSFLAYAAALYLSALRDVRIRAMYYGMLRREEPETPFLDLTPLLLDLPRWFHALEVLKKTGTPSVIADLLGDGSGVENLVRVLRGASEVHASALPLELGRQARLFLKDHPRPLRKHLRSRRLPRAREIVERLEELLQPQALDQLPPGDGWKRKLGLTAVELGRQRRLVDDLLERRNYPGALGLMNEWMVSWAVLKLGLEGDWLDYHGVRRRATQWLRAMASVAAERDLQQVLSPEQRKLAEFWKDLSELRNALHHHGMRGEVLLSQGKGKFAQRLAQVSAYWRGLPEEGPEIELRFGLEPIDSLLLTPVGRKPGVLYSALLATRERLVRWPAAVRAVCSRDSVAAVDGAARRAGFRGRVEPLVLEDPYGGRQQLAALVGEARPVLLSAESVFVNVTGGTTLMGLAMETLAGEARKLARPVLRFGLIDRRPSAEQEAAPYRQGEAFWLDEEERDERSP